MDPKLQYTTVMVVHYKGSTGVMGVIDEQSLSFQRSLELTFTMLKWHAMDPSGVGKA